MPYIFTLFSILFLFVGLVGGWFISDKYREYMQHERHAFEDLFEQNPHPELFNDDGELNRGDYYVVHFEPGYDPEEFTPDDISEE